MVYRFNRTLYTIYIVAKKKVRYTSDNQLSMLVVERRFSWVERKTEDLVGIGILRQNQQLRLLPRLHYSLHLHRNRRDFGNKLILLILSRFFLSRYRLL